MTYGSEKQRLPAKHGEPREGEGDLRLAVHRCPFCHDDAGGENSSVCSACLARHHAGCWNESGRCGACGGTRRLTPEPLTLSTAIALLEGHGYRAEEIRALLAPATSERPAARRSLMGPALLMLLIGGVVTLAGCILADSLLMGSDEYVGAAVALLVGTFVGLFVFFAALRRQ